MSVREPIAAIVLFLFVWPASRAALAQGNPPTLITMADAVRIALAYNQTLRAQRTNIDQSKAGEMTASLKPNPTFSTLVDTIPIFSPQMIRLGTQIYSEDLSYTVERGGKREKRGVVAKDNTDVSVKPSPTTNANCGFKLSQAFINASAGEIRASTG